VSVSGEYTSRYEAELGNYFKRVPHLHVHPSPWKAAEIVHSLKWRHNILLLQIVRYKQRRRMIHILVLVQPLQDFILGGEI
jgi:hypothetical protein